MGKQTTRQKARLAASQVQATRRRERSERDRRLEKLAFEVLAALGERDATITATEHRAGAALQRMITDDPTELLVSAEQLLRRICVVGRQARLLGLRVLVAELIWEVNTSAGA